MHSSFDPQTPRKVGNVVIGALLAIGFYTFVLGRNTDSTSVVTAQGTTSSDAVVTVAPTSSPSAVQSSATATPTAAPSGYKDGTYSVTIGYSVPHGQNSLSVKMTLSSGLITDVTATDSYSDYESERYTSGFDSSINSVAVGKSVSSLSVSRLSGASLTSSAFNAALSKIKASAKA
jgi:uncharacterized protein with FMN-binding domain